MAAGDLLRMLALQLYVTWEVSLSRGVTARLSNLFRVCGLIYHCLAD